MLFDFTETKNENIYKLLTSTIGPRPIAWVTTQDVDGTVNAAPFSFFKAMSGNPPVLAFGIGGGGPGGVPGRLEGPRGEYPAHRPVRDQSCQLRAARTDECHGHRFSEKC